MKDIDINLIEKQANTLLKNTIRNCKIKGYYTSYDIKGQALIDLKDNYFQYYEDELRTFLQHKHYLWKKYTIEFDTLYKLNNNNVVCILINTYLIAIPLFYGNYFNIEWVKINDKSVRILTPKSEHKDISFLLTEIYNSSIKIQSFEHYLNDHYNIDNIAQFMYDKENNTLHVRLKMGEKLDFFSDYDEESIKCIEYFGQ